MTNGEHNITDVVYFMYNNAPAKGVITNKCIQTVRMIEIPDLVAHNTIRNNPSAIIQLIQTEHSTAYQISLIPPDKDNIQYKPINGWFADDYLYDSKEELLSALAEMPV